MRIERTAIEGVAIIELERREDDRGFFARTYDRAEFEAAGLERQDLAPVRRPNRPCVLEGEWLRIVA